MRHRTARRAALSWPLLAALPLLAACPAQDPDLAQLDRLKTQQAAGQLADIAAGPAPCTARGETCAQAQEIRADACMTLARRAPDAPAAAGQRDCALRAFEAARQALPDTAAPERLGRILANEAATAMDQRDRTGQGTDRQLAAAEALLRLNPRDPAGCYHLASARLARALLLPAGRARCPELVPVASCQGVAPPPGLSSGVRLPIEQITVERQRIGCP
jgi:hypothetical protein